MNISIVSMKKKQFGKIYVLIEVNDAIKYYLTTPNKQVEDKIKKYIAKNSFYHKMGI